MTGAQLLAWATIGVPAVVALWLGLRNNRSLNYTTISDRLDKVEKQLEETEERERKGEIIRQRQGRFIYVLIAALERHDIEVPAPPEPLEELGL